MRRLKNLTKAQSFVNFKIIKRDIGAVQRQNLSLTQSSNLCWFFNLRDIKRSDVQLSLQFLGVHMTSPKFKLTNYRFFFLLPLGITEPKHLYLHNFFLSYGITTLYRDMASDESLFDLADYPRDHFLHGRKNHKVLGKLKGECQGIPFQEFVGLRPQLYSTRLSPYDDKCCILSHGFKIPWLMDTMNYTEEYEIIKLLTHL